jgi:hypothetical protein
MPEDHRSSTGVMSNPDQGRRMLLRGAAACGCGYTTAFIREWMNHLVRCPDYTLKGEHDVSTDME